MHIEGGLGHHINGFLFLKLRGESFQLLQICKNSHFSRSMAHNSLNLRVRSIPCDQKERPVSPCFRSNLMDFCNERAGGIMKRQAPCVDFVIDLPGDAMAADHHLISVGYLFHRVTGNGAPALQVLNHLGAVDQRTQGGHLAAFPQQLVGHLDRAVHTKTEPGGFGKNYLHGITSFRWHRAAAHWNLFCSYSRSSSSLRRLRRARSLGTERRGSSTFISAAGMGVPKQMRIRQNRCIRWSGVS